MVKNYLVGAVRPVIKRWYGETDEQVSHDNPDSKQHLAFYQEMYRISRLSARKFLAGEWEEVLHSAPCLDARFFQIAQWYLVKEMWFREPCNILCMGADTLFIRPTEIFGQWSEMRMFNYTDPRHHEEFPHYFNDDIRYYPHDMNPAVWEVGERRMREWVSHNQATWDLGQLIHNSMFWSQNLDQAEVLRPYLNWMCHCLRSLSDDDVAAAEEWNRCPSRYTQILHLCSSRGAKSTLDFMQEIARKFDIAF